MKKRIISIILTVLMLVSAIPVIVLQAEETSIVTNGLVAHYDGKQNTRKGHDAAATVWEDLAGNNDITVAKNANSYFTEDAFYLSKTQYNFPKALLDIVNGNAFTVELSIGDFILHGSGYATIINSNSNDNFAFFVRKSNDVLEFKNGSNSRPMVQSGSDAIRNSTVTVTFEKGKVCSIYIDGICQAKSVPSAAIGAAGNLFFGHADATRSHTTEFKAIRFYNRALTEAEVIQNAVVDGNYDENYVPPMPYVEVKQSKTNIIGDIAFIEELKTAEQLATYAEGEVPSTVILSLNEELNVLDADGKTIGSLENVLEKLDGIIPAFRVKNKESGKALTDYMASVKMEDAFLISEDAAIIKAVRGDYPMLRGVLDLRNSYAKKTPDNETLLALRKEVNVAPCRIALLPGHFSDAEIIDRLNDLQVTTWLASANSESKADALHELLSGAYGIVTDDTGRMLSVAQEYIVQNTMTRSALNIGHRGYPTGKYPENSLEGSLEAYEMGADAVEMDIYLTADGHIAVCHNSTTDAMFDKNLSVEASTMAQLKSLKFKGTELRLPSLEEYFATFKGKDILLVIEIKSAKREIVPALKALIDKYDMYGQCYVIGYFKQAVFDELLKVMPEMPVGYLTGVTNGLSDSEAMRVPLSTVQPYNATWNPSKAGYTADFTRMAVLRGLMTSPYTINSEAELYSYLSYGHTAVTTDYCNYIGNMYQKLDFAMGESAKVEPKTEIAYTVKATTWARNEMNVSGNAKLEILEGEDLVRIESGKLVFGEKEGKVVLLPSFTSAIGSATYTLYEQPVTITIEKPAPKPSVYVEQPGDNFTTDTAIDRIEFEVIIGVIAAVLVLAAIVIAVILKKRKAK